MSSVSMFKTVAASWDYIQLGSCFLAKAVLHVLRSLRERMYVQKVRFRAGASRVSGLQIAFDTRSVLCPHGALVFVKFILWEIIPFHRE